MEELEMKLKFTAEEANFLKYQSSNIVTNGNSYHYLPFWYKENKDGTFTPYSTENLPNELQTAIKEFKI